MTHNPPTSQLGLDAIQAKAAELRERLDRRNPWPSDNESHWTTEGWKAGTRNALDKLHVEQLVDEVRRLRAALAAAGRRDITSPLAVIVKHGEMSETVRQEISDLLAAAEGLAEETHVVADDSDDPEHIDDCPGCAAPPA